MDMSNPSQAEVHVRERMVRLRGEADRKRRTVPETLDESKSSLPGMSVLVALFAMLRSRWFA